jgi:hypothetical protein
MLQSEAGYIDARPLTPARQNLLQRTAGPYMWVTSVGLSNRWSPGKRGFRRAEITNWLKRLLAGVPTVQIAPPGTVSVADAPLRLPDPGRRVLQRGRRSGNPSARHPWCRSQSPKRSRGRERRGRLQGHTARDCIHQFLASSTPLQTWNTVPVSVAAATPPHSFALLSTSRHSSARTPH